MKHLCFRSAGMFAAKVRIIIHIKRIFHIKLLKTKKNVPKLWINHSTTRYYLTSNAEITEMAFARQKLGRQSLSW